MFLLHFTILYKTLLVHHYVTKKFTFIELFITILLIKYCTYLIVHK